MTDALSIALSGLMAQNQTLSATASNIANVTTTGALPTPQSPASTVYKPLNVNYTTLTDGGVIANVTPNAAPNVDLAQQIVNLIETKTAYKANVDVIKAQDEMMGDLLNTIT